MIHPTGIHTPLPCPACGAPGDGAWCGRCGARRDPAAGLGPLLQRARHRLQDRAPVALLDALAAASPGGARAAADDPALRPPGGLGLDALPDLLGAGRLALHLRGSQLLPRSERALLDPLLPLISAPLAVVVHAAGLGADGADEARARAGAWLRHHGREAPVFCLPADQGPLEAWISGPPDTLPLAGALRALAAAVDAAPPVGDAPPALEALEAELAAREARARAAAAEALAQIPPPDGLPALVAAGRAAEAVAAAVGAAEAAAERALAAAEALLQAPGSAAPVPPPERPAVDRAADPAAGPALAAAAAAGLLGLALIPVPGAAWWGAGLTAGSLLTARTIQREAQARRAARLGAELEAWLAAQAPALRAAVDAALEARAAHARVALAAAHARAARAWALAQDPGLAPALRAAAEGR